MKCKEDKVNVKVTAGRYMKVIGEKQRRMARSGWFGAEGEESKMLFCLSNEKDFINSPRTYLSQE